MMTDDHERERTTERGAMDWWNSLTERQRAEVMERAEAVVASPSIAEAWNLLVAGEIVGPPLPSGVGLVGDVPGADRRRDRQLRDFRCPCCGVFLGRVNPTLPGLTWCERCRIEISVKPCPNPPTI
jgi:hypothetical protein